MYYDDLISNIKFMKFLQWVRYKRGNPPGYIVHVITGLKEKSEHYSSQKEARAAILPRSRSTQVIKDAIYTVRNFKS